jgi:hypothetical protein
MRHMCDNVIHYRRSDAAHLSPELAVRFLGCISSETMMLIFPLQIYSPAYLPS